MAKDNVLKLRRKEDKAKIGYHYTSGPNWESIQRTGFLIPTPTRNAELIRENVRTSVCVYSRPQLGIAHTGQILERVMALGSFVIVLLEVRYSDADLFPFPSDVRSITACSSIGHANGAIMFFNRGEPLDVLVKEVPLSRLRMLATYDLMKMLEVPG
jgi:hypothetical protein